MKRSKINAEIRWAEELLNNFQIRLPAFAYWDLRQWEQNEGKTALHRAVALGWDITDFGSGDFENIGAVLFTARNGSLHDRAIGPPYAEKYILLKEGQFLPTHYHAMKTEDIINRAGGTMKMRFFSRRDDGSVDIKSPVTVLIDGVPTSLAAGEDVFLGPGSGVCIPPYLYHSFGARKGGGPLIAGEVSSVNDDRSDNFFSPPVSRFAKIEEDEPVFRPLSNELALRKELSHE